MAHLTRRLALALILGAAAGTAGAQAPAPTVRIRGRIRALDGNVLVVATREGPEARIALNDPLTARTIRKAPLADIAAGTYVGIAAEPGADGKLLAQEVLIFPAAMRGAAEGHRAWDLTPKSTMTNATVDAMVQGASGNVLTLKHKDGMTEITVPPDAPIVTFGPGGRDDLKPGQGVIIFGAARAADGSLSTAAVTVGKDGVDPPM